VSSAWLETLKASVQTAVNCDVHHGFRRLGFHGHMIFLVVELFKELLGKRAAGEMLSDDELAHNIILQVSSSLQ